MLSVRVALKILALLADSMKKKKMAKQIHFIVVEWCAKGIETAREHHSQEQAFAINTKLNSFTTAIRVAISIVKVLE